MHGTVRLCEKNHEKWLDGAKESDMQQPANCNSSRESDGTKIREEFARIGKSKVDKQTYTHRKILLLSSFGHVYLCIGSALLPSPHGLFIVLFVFRSLPFELGVWSNKNWIVFTHRQSACLPFYLHVPRDVYCVGDKMERKKEGRNEEKRTTTLQYFFGQLRLHKTMGCLLIFMRQCSSYITPLPTAHYLRLFLSCFVL